MNPAALEPARRASKPRTRRLYLNNQIAKRVDQHPNRSDSAHMQPNTNTVRSHGASPKIDE